MKGSKGDYVLEQENYASEQILEVSKEKDDLLRKAKEAARRETASYEEEKRNDCMQRVTQLTSNTDLIDEIFEKKEKDLELIKEQYNQNKDKVIDFLFKNVIKVEFSVPDVVKGCFEEKFGIKDE